ncbi:hypothetical protein F8S09_09760 [Deinococcus sp. SDU3-2]|uniref:Uncharacterized protein n=1 Tax=Deinococcus terrestris TaxID=2651870 RepID=A0A7X1TS09_9DEIO|nr:hypothetical protein [Deinococcus terrestris]MPY66971.1 hypothetical protein [Deinococcus terrestris]
MRRLILSALLALAPGTLAAAQLAPPPTVQSIPATPLRSAAPAAATATTPAVAVPFQNGQTWLLEGRTDRGRAFRSELVLGPLRVEEQRLFQEGLRQAGGLGQGAINAVFAGTPQGAGEAQILMVARAADESLVTVIPNPSVDDLLADPEAEMEELTFCFLLADPGGRSFSGLSLRMREEGETYTVTGTVGGTAGTAQPNGREAMLTALRGIYAPLFGVGECKLTRR